MPTALITGASSGIGRAFAEQLARRGYDLIAVARTRSALDDLARTVRTSAGVHVETMAVDLATAGGCATVERRLTAGEAVDFLVNSAGTVLSRPFQANDVADEATLLDLNIRAVMRLTHAALPRMIERRSGQVVNVSSFTALGIGGLATTYPASKAWVLAFTEAVARSREVVTSGVRMMTLLPGFTATDFFDRNQLGTLNLPSWAWLSPGHVVATALSDLARGRYVSIPSRRYKCASWALRHLPHPLIRPFTWDFTNPSALWRDPRRHRHGTRTQDHP
ncbi:MULTISPECIES: SDR family NAD(P)-dependent oxidoreductase [unclassified Streptomyces]|uniref:SDR family NAD(P)-dependent oxidoreductase n=1 Tax=unclassified Streptomyces TaxID=2593676 RepID=UPI000C27C5F3|nr:SDR family NAD(P)-dependent oxidoreductase [Streptomyces sp. CB02959]PJN40290.1 short-chain dehydrogenase [Streptomyces sp. CB02959]